VPQLVAASIDWLQRRNRFFYTQQPDDVVGLAAMAR
jgi:hypothetical protein